MAYQHGVYVFEQPTSIVAPILGTAGLQVVFGTAPVNLAEDPYAATNTPIMAYSYAEAVKKLGFSYDFKNYTLCQSIYASFMLTPVAPVIFINVLDPKKHKKSNEPAASVPVVNHQAVVKTTGILLDTVKIQISPETPLALDTDYTLGFDEDGYLIITLNPSGKAKSADTLTVNSDSIDPTAVQAKDIIGGLDPMTGAETGMELIRHIYPKFGMTPGLLLAPGWSQNPDVGIVMAAKCEEINGAFRCECFVDIDSNPDTGAKTYDKVKEKKEASGLTSIHAMALWPCVKSGSHQLRLSAVMGALMAFTDAKNDNVPNLSPSNKMVGITGLCLEDGSEVVLDQTQANFLNSVGVSTAINCNGWRAWGNNTSAYPGNSDPKDRWFNCRRFFSWWANSFIMTYFQKVDDPANPRLIESVVDSENIRGNAYVAQGKCAIAQIEFDPVSTDILNGKLVFHQRLAPYPPAEAIVNKLEFDANALSAALGG